MKKIILTFIVILFVSLSFGQKKYKARWQKERFSLGVIAYSNTPLLNDDFGTKLSLSTRILYFTSLELNIVSNTKEIYGETNLKVYLIPKKYIRNISFQKNLKRRMYMYLNTSLDTYQNIGVGMGAGYNINNKWRMEGILLNKIKNGKDDSKLNLYLGFGLFRNLNFKEYPPRINAKY